MYWSMNIQEGYEAAGMNHGVVCCAWLWTAHYTLELETACVKMRLLFICSRH